MQIGGKGVILTAQTMFKLERIYYYLVAHLSPILYPFKGIAWVTPPVSNPCSLLHLGNHIQLFKILFLFQNSIQFLGI